MLQSLSHFLLVPRVKCFYANPTGRDGMISSGWTVRKEVGSSDSLLGCKNRPRRNRFCGVVALMSVCRYASGVCLGSAMTVFRDQTWPYTAEWAPEHTANAAMLIRHRAGRILAAYMESALGHEWNPLSPFLTFIHCVAGAERQEGERAGHVAWLLWRFETEEDLSVCTLLERWKKKNHPAVNRWVG